MSPGRSEAIETAKMMLRPDVVILDTETTDLGYDAQIIEIACISATTGGVLFDSLVRPSCRVSREAAQIHGISDKDLRQAPTPAQLLPVLREVLDDKTVLSYNFDFDRRLMDQTLDAACLDWPTTWDQWWLPAEQYCIMEWYAAFWGDWSERHERFMWQSLPLAISQCGIKLDQPLDRALADAKAALAVLNYMASQ